MNQPNLPIWELDLLIPSDSNQACQLIRKTASYLEEQGWSETDVFAVHMGLEEAIMNSIKHGNKRNAEKQVRIHVKVFTDHILMTVSDEGEGFNPKDLPDPCCPENLDKDCGRGISLMKGFMDRVEYHQGGRTVTMRKKRTSTDNKGPAN
jgi:serine/threonine-protein kinase RsbW